MAEVDETTCKQMEGLVELLTTSGKPTLNPEIMKKFKKFCRISDGHVRYAYTLLMSRLAEEHSEVRLSAYQMVDELFNRSHLFRELLLEDFDSFLEFTAETEKRKPLPAPKAAANTMKTGALRSVLLWNEKFGAGYKKLALGLEFLKNVKKIDFDNIQAEIELERRQKEETERKMEEQRQEKLQQVDKEYSEREMDIHLCLTEIENGLQLLMPKPDDFFIPLTGKMGASGTHTVTSSMTSSSDNKSDMISADDRLKLCEKSKVKEDTDEVNDKLANEKGDIYAVNLPHNVTNNSGTTTVDGQNTLENNIESESESDSEFEDVHSGQNHAFTQEYGQFDRKFALTIKVCQPATSLQETEDNEDLIQGVRDQYRLIKTKYLPAVKKWLQVMSDNQASAEKVKDMTARKVKLEDAVRKCVELEIASGRRNRDDSDSDDDDFEEVPEKEGYEEEVPEHVRLDAAMASKKQESKTKEKKSKKGKQPKETTKKETARAKKVRKMAQELLESQRLLQEDDLDSAVLKSRTVKGKGRPPQPSTSYSAQSTSCNDSNQPSTSQVSELKTVSHTARHKEPKDTNHCLDETSRKTSLLEKAPVVSFGVDLEHWEDPSKIRAPVKNRFEDASRFWVQEKEVDDQEPGGSEEVAALTRRTVTFVGEFEPVRWKCRALLPNEKLCDRMDREKCPFHGKIIGRDKSGQPTNPDDKERLLLERLQQDIEQESESSASSEGKGQGKGKKKAKKRKYPNLTDIKESSDTSRSRLEAKIFNRSTLKKVNKALDEVAMKKLSQKFGNQFNYSLK